MLDKFRVLHKEKLAVKIITVLVIVFFSIAIMLPLIKLAELCGVNILDNGGLDFEVTFGYIFFFFLFGICSVTIIWLAQKHLHKGKLFDLGFRSKVSKFLLIGFLFGAFKAVLVYVVYMCTSSHFVCTPVVPNNISALTYIGYYTYFLFGFILWNSFIEELGTRAYPIEKLKKHLNPHLIFTLMGILFTAGHFVVHEFELGYCLSLFISSYLLSLVYYYSNSIWLVIGVHNGMNWVGFSFAGSNWKLGALVKFEFYDVPSWIVSFSSTILGLLLLLLVVYANKKGFFKRIARVKN